MYLTTRDLVLQPVRQQDLADLAALFMDDTVKQTYMVPDFATREDAKKLFEQIKALSWKNDRFVAGVYLNGAFAGLINETEIKDKTIELGYAFLPKFHNCGYCTETLMGAVQYLFQCGFEEVVAGAFEDNLPSIRVMEKCGMQKLDKQEEISYLGETHCCVYYSRKKK
jgi:RimJ/RimL family protein N-acetyltransferase